MQAGPGFLQVGSSIAHHCISWLSVDTPPANSSVQNLVGQGLAEWQAVASESDGVAAPLCFEGRSVHTHPDGRV